MLAGLKIAKVLGRLCFVVACLSFSVRITFACKWEVIDRFKFSPYLSKSFFDFSLQIAIFSTFFCYSEIFWC